MIDQIVQADDGFYFGMGLFETMAMRHGRPVLEELHIRRLADGLRKLHIHNQSYQQYLHDQICLQDKQYAHKKGLFGKHEDSSSPRQKTGTDAKASWTKESPEAWMQSVIDHYLGSHPDIPENGVLKLTITEKNLRFDIRTNPYTEQQFREGLRLHFSPVLRNETSPFTYYKTLNCGDSILVHRQIQKMGYDEAVFMNTRGEICEGSVSNVFFTRGDLVVTPPVSCGLLKGTVRAFLLHSSMRTCSVCGRSEQCREEGTDIVFREQVIRTEDLSSFTGMFITNALMGIMPVRSLGAHQFPDRHIAEILRRRYLQKAMHLDINGR